MTHDRPIYNPALALTIVTTRKHSMSKMPQSVTFSGDKYIYGLQNGTTYGTDFGWPLPW